MANRLRNVVVGAAVLIAGAIGLFLPVSVFDGNSSTIGCGNAVAADQTVPRAANDATAAGVPVANQVILHPDYVAECDAAISGRRHWAIPLVIVGAAGLVLGILARGRRSAERRAARGRPPQRAPSSSSSVPPSLS